MIFFRQLIDDRSIFIKLYLIQKLKNLKAVNLNRYIITNINQNIYVIMEFKQLRKEILL